MGEGVLPDGSIQTIEGNSSERKPTGWQERSAPSGCPKAQRARALEERLEDGRDPTDVAGGSTHAAALRRAIEDGPSRDR